MILKSWKLIHDQQKFTSNLLSNPNGGFLTPEAQKTWIMTMSKNQKIWQKLSTYKTTKIFKKKRPNVQKIADICVIKKFKKLFNRQ